MKPNQRAHGVVVSHPLSMREALGLIPSVSIVYERFHRRNQVNVIMRSVSLPCAEHALRMLRSTSAVVKLKRESNDRNMRTHVAPEKMNFRSCLRALLTPCIRNANCDDALQHKLVINDLASLWKTLVPHRHLIEALSLSSGTIHCGCALDARRAIQGPPPRSNLEIS